MFRFFRSSGPDGRWRFRPEYVAPAILLALAVGVGLFFAVGNLVVWLWRVTLVDIFNIKAISFWQAWGLILLAQFLFKANMHPMTRTGRWRRRCDTTGDASSQAGPGRPVTPS